MNVIQIFSTPLWESPMAQFDQHRETWQAALQQRREQQPQGNPGNYIEGSGYMSMPDLTLIPDLAPLYEYISQIVIKASFDMQFRGGGVYITSAWHVVMDQPNASIPEQNFYDTFTGVMFLEAPRGSPRLQLRNTGMNPLWQGRGIIDKRNRFNAKNITIDPEPGMVFMWPSSVPHSMTANQQDGTFSALFFTALIMADVPTAPEPESQPDAATDTPQQ